MAVSPKDFLEDDPELALEALENFEFFFSLGAEEIQNLIPLFKRVHVAAGHTLVEAGAEGKGLFLVASGQARMHRSFIAPSHQDKTLAIFGPGDVFGETNLLSETPNPFSVTSMTSLKLYQLSKSAFMDILKRQPHLVLNLMKMLFQQGSEILRGTNLELALQYEVGRIISMPLPVSEMVGRLLRQMILSMEVEAAAMLYLNHASGMFEVIGTEGQKAIKCNAINFRHQMPALRQLIETGKPLVLRPVPQGASSSALHIPGLESHNVLICPLIEEGSLNGLIILLDNKNAKPFSRFQEQVMDDLGHVLSSAVGLAKERENERAMERLRQKRFK